ncbi:MAG: Fic family protein [Acidobacteriota bacterium]
MDDKKSAQNNPLGQIGLVRLVQDLGLSVPLPAVRSEIVAGARQTRIADGVVYERYPRSYAPDGIIGNLKFAMRYEAVDLGVLFAVLQALDPKVLEQWVREEHTGVFARRAWYLYELLTGQTLDVSDVPPTGYVNILDPVIHITGSSVRIRRQLVNDNLLGSAAYCPLIRRTETLRNSMQAGLDKEARALVERCDPGLLARAVNYLYTKETKSSFAIEGEAPSADRAQRFVTTLTDAVHFNTLEQQSFVRLQNAIVDPRYAETGWRTDQNFVGQTRSDFTEHVHFVCPKPADVPSLMQGWMQMVERLHRPPLEPVCAAAAMSFGFVFIHPFEDGNGRIHRFLIHHMLARAGFTPSGLLFPVSAAMLRDRSAYDRVLNAYSSSIMPFIKYAVDDQGRMSIDNATAHLYRYWDATPVAEYLYSCVTEAIRRDLREEIGFLTVFDGALRRAVDIVDMPDRRASLLVRLIMQNSGELAQNRRKQFPELSDHEISSIEAAVRSCIEAGGLSPEAGVRLQGPGFRE